MLKEINERRSVRSYKDDKINKETILELIQAGILAPSAKNKQPWRFVIVDDEIKNKIGNKMIEIYGKNKTAEVIKTAPYLILVYNTIDEYLSRLSIGACIENILLEATNRNLGTLWIGYIKKIEDYVNDLVGSNLELVSAISVGIKNESPIARPRLKLEEVIIECNN